MRAFLARLAVIFAHVISHFVEGGSGKENLLHALALHRLRIGVGDRAAAAAENLDIVRALFAQLFHYVGEKLDVPPIVTRDADRAHVLLNGGAHDVADRSMISKINDLDPVADKLEIDRVDGAVVSITNRNGGQNTNR